MDIYCVYLTIYRGNKLPPFYIGSTSVKNIKSGYRGSVCSKKYKTIWKDEIKNNEHLFETRILCRFKDRKEATIKENILHRKLKVITNELYINQSYAVCDSFVDMDKSGKNNGMYGSHRTGDKNPFFNMKHTEKSKNKMRGSKEQRLNKLNNTLKSRYGVSNVAVLPYVKNKKVETYLEKYGVEHHNKTPEHRSQISNKRKSDSSREIYLEVKELYKKLQRKIPKGTYMLSDDKLVNIRNILSNELQS
jgi:hypothetical protein